MRTPTIIASATFVFLLCFVPPALAQERMTLEDSICTALTRNYQVRAAEAKAAGQEYNAKGAFADLLPKVKVSGQYFRTGPIATLNFDMSSLFGSFDPNNLPASLKSDLGFLAWLQNFGKFGEAMKAMPAQEGMAVSDADQVSLQFRVEQPLFSLYPAYQGYQMQQDGVEMMRLAQKATAQEVRSQVVATYLGALKARKLLAIAKESVDLIGQHLDQAKKFVAAGVAHVSDQLMAEVKLSEARNNVVRAENGLTLAKAGLSLLMGSGAGVEFEVVDIPVEGPVPRVSAGLGELLEMAKGRRSEMKILERQADLAERSVNLQWSGYIPQSALVGSYGYQHGNTFMPDWSWAVGGVASLTLWDWLKTHDQIQAAKHALREAKEQQEYAREGVLFAVKQAYYDLRTSEQVMVTGEAAIKEAKENHRVAKMKYEAQMATSVDVLDAAVMRAKAETEYFAAVYDYRAALSKLARAVEQDESAISDAKPTAGRCQDR